MRIALLALSCLAGPAAAQLPAGAPLPATLSGALDAGTTVNGVATEGKASLHPILVLKGDAVVMSLRGKGPVELAVYGPDGAPLTRSTGEGTVGMRWSFQADGTHFLAVLAAPDSRYSLDLRRVEAAAVRPPVDPKWGIYAFLAGKTAESEAAPPLPAYRMQWAWELPGEVMVERVHESASGKPVYTGCIRRPAGAPYPTLTITGSEWLGGVMPDGAMIWRSGVSSSAEFKSELTAEGKLLLSKLDGTGQTLYRLSTTSSGQTTPAGSPGRLCQAPSAGQ
jgi:hypothetical protein